MAGNVSNAEANTILDNRLGSGDPASVYFRAMTTADGNSGGGVEVSDGVWTDYAPVEVDNDATHFPAAASREKANDLVITFSTAAVIVGTPPVIVGVSVYDAPTGGNLIYWYTLAVPMTINNGNPVSIPIGAFAVEVAA